MPPPSGPDPSPAPPAAPARSLVDGYKPLPDVADMLLDKQGVVRADWKSLVDRLGSLTPEVLAFRQQKAQQALNDNGILLGGPNEVAQPHLWPLDPLPFQLGQESFRLIREGMSQRARLLNLLAGDLLGPQRVLREKVLPPALLFANPHYRRAYHDLPVAGGRYIHLYAADVARADDGRWWVRGDRTQAPSGLGFTLENRIAVSRVHADWFGKMNVRRHAGFFHTMRQTLTRLATNKVENPRIVLLSEGPTGHRGFEDAFLARYLGYTLTVGQDLAVRQGRTVLKTLGGALPVEVILRRINDDACDPVELDSDSTHGVAGLVESQRLSHLAIANMLGSQLVEAPGLMAFIAPLCRFLLGEDLKLPSVATWWCGQKREREYVIKHLDELYIFPAFRAGAAPIDSQRLSARQRADLIAQVRQHPEQFAGQERLRRGTAPVWSEGRLEPWHWALRLFAVMREDAYDALPGGLVRLARQGGVLDYAPSPGERTQDCWVVSDAPVDTMSLLPPSNQPLTLKRSGAELPSRVAEHLYWLGRSMEAAEGRARLLRGLIARIESESVWGTATPNDGWRRLLGLLDGGKGHAMSPARRIKHASLDAPAPGNLRYAVRECVRLAQAARDRISLDAWRLVARMERYLLRAAVTNPVNTEDLSDLAALLNHLVLELVGFGGLMSESMTRTLGWRFLDLGRRMERAHHTAELLRLALVRPSIDERVMLETVLEICDSSMTYRSRYLADLRPVPTIDLLLTDDINPRSIAYQLHKLEEQVNHLPRDTASGPRDPDQRAALTLLDAVRLADPAALARTDEPAMQRSALDALLRRVIDDLPVIDQALTARYLAHTALPKQFAQIDLSAPPEPGSGNIVGHTPDGGIDTGGDA